MIEEKHGHYTQRDWQKAIEERQRIKEAMKEHEKSFEMSDEDLESFTRECNAIADEWEEDLDMLVFTKDYLNNPAVKKVIQELKQK